MKMPKVGLLVALTGLAIFLLNPGELRAQFQNNLQSSLKDLGASGVEISPASGYMVLQKLIISGTNTDILMSKLLSDGSYVTPSVRIGTDKSDVPQYIQKTYTTVNGTAVHDGYIVVGVTNYNGDNDLFLLRTNLSGAVLWSYRYGKAISNEYGFYVQQAPDGGFIACGYTEANDIVKRPYVLRTNANGIPVWNCVYPFAVEGVANNFVTTRNASGTGLTGIYATGYIKNAAGNKDVLLMSINPADGQALWLNRYASSSFGTANEEGVCIKLVNNGNKLVITGNYNSNAVYTLKTDLFGAPVWGFRYFVGGSILQSTSIEPDPNYPNSLLIGGTISTGSDKRVFYQQINSNGAVLICKKNYLDTPGTSLSDMRLTSDGGFFAVGSYQPSSSQFDTYISKIDKDLLTTINCPPVKQTISRNGGIVYTQLDTAAAINLNYFDLPLLSLNESFSQDLCNEANLTGNPAGLNVATVDAAGEEFSMYPNPALSSQSELALQTNLLEPNTPFTVRITDVTGRQYANFQFEDNLGGLQHLQVGALPAGAFLVSVIQNDKLVKTARYIRGR